MVSSDELNYLIYRYLQESGFLHSSFTFAHESLAYKTDIKPGSVAGGTLVNLVHKGLKLIEIEAHLNEDGTQKNCLKPFSLIDKHVCEINPSTPVIKPFRSMPSNVAPASASNTAKEEKPSTLQTKKDGVKEESKKKDKRFKDESVGVTEQVMDAESRDMDTSIENVNIKKDPEEKIDHMEQ